MAHSQIHKMFWLVLILATVIGALARATVSDLAVDLKRGTYTAEDLQNLGKCLEQTSSSSSVSSDVGAKASRCPTAVKDVENDLTVDAYLFPNPELTMCYRLKNKKLGEFGDKYTGLHLTDSGSISTEETPGAWFTVAKEYSQCPKSKLPGCEAGFAAKFQTKFDIVPKVLATAKIDSYFRPWDATISLDVDIVATVTTGISVVAGGSCSHTETRYFPAIPKPVASFCYFSACVVVFIQGMTELKIEGRLLAGATAVHQIQFGGDGNIEIATANMKKTGGDLWTVKPTKSAWRTEAYGDMNGKVSLKMGPVVSVMFTPGIGSLWASAIPWIQAEVSMFGAMKYENHGSNDLDLSISDELFKAHTVNNQCIPAPIKDNYPPLPSGSKGGSDGADSCFAAAVALRTGVEFDVGFLPKSLSNKDEVKMAVKEYVCDHKVQGKGVSGASSSAPRSVYEDGFMQAIESARASARARASASGGAADDEDGVSQCLGLPKRRPGEVSASFFGFQYWCHHMVDLLFSAIPNKVEPLFTAELALTCNDVKFYTSDQCKDEVGCVADEADPSKCLEHGQLDNDCCALKGTNTCADDYDMEQSEHVCYKNTQFTAYSYSCHKPDVVVVQAEQDRLPMLRRLRSRKS